MAGSDSSGSLGPSSDAATSGDKKCPIQDFWKALPGLMERVTTKGRISHLGPSGVRRQCVIDNVDVIEPVINALGALIQSSVM